LVIIQLDPNPTFLFIIYFNAFTKKNLRINSRIGPGFSPYVNDTFTHFHRRAVFKTISLNLAFQIRRG
jgi:hypothetical protein